MQSQQISTDDIGAFLLRMGLYASLDPKGGSWQQYGGLLLRAVAFPQKSEGARSHQKPECESIRVFTFLPLTYSLLLETHSGFW